MLTNKLAFKWVLHFILQGYVVMDIKLGCAWICLCVHLCLCESVSVGVCVCLCVVRKLPTDKSPREVLEQVCLGLVWERVEWRRACPACSSLHEFEGGRVKWSRLLQKIWWPFSDRQKFPLNLMWLIVLFFFSRARSLHEKKNSRLVCPCAGLLWIVLHFWLGS